MAYRGVTILSGLLAGALLAALPVAAPANTPVAPALDPSLREWVSQYAVPAASAAIMQNERLVATFGFGGMQAGAPSRIASLSKAITGICIAQLVDAGRLSFTTPLGGVLAPTFARLGQPVDPRFKAITIEQLLRHRAGLPREAMRGAPARDLKGSFVNILATPLAENPDGAMTYSNIGYLTLGMVVEAVTGSDYERYCREVALRPMRATGAIDPQLRQRASSGGWRVSAVDYARFIQVFEPGSAALGPRGRAWQDALDGRRAYGLGVGILRTERGAILTHTGRVALRERGGSYVIKFPNGWTAVTAFAGDPLPGATADLRRRFEAVIAGL
jgi:CubicO group peptidase (beta-lactamase class C family)